MSTSNSPASATPTVNSEVAPVMGGDSKRDTLDLIREFRVSQQTSSKPTAGETKPADKPDVSIQTDENNPVPSGERDPESGIPEVVQEYLEVDGRKIAVDFNDREKLRSELKAKYELERKAKAFQSDRDRMATERKQLDGEYQKLKANWEAMDKAYKEQGELGVLDLLSGKEGASQEWLKRQIERHEYLRDASPAERKALEDRERETKYIRELERQVELSKQTQVEAAERIKQAEVRDLQNVFNTAAEKYGFHGKLGNTENEDLLDEMVHNQVMATLGKFEESKLTPEQITSEFATVSNKLRKQIGMQADRTASKVLESKKQAATEAVQTAVRNDTDPGARTREEAQALLKRGNYTQLLKGWGRFGKHLK